MGYASPLEARIAKKVTKAITEYNLIEDGDRVMVGLSGGKDSTALAIYMRDREPQMEYVFCDTQKELPETYEYLDRLESYLGKPIVRLNADRGFDHYLKLYNNYLPSSRMRWCTRQLKIRPFERYVGTAPVVSYVGIRADEDREGLERVGAELDVGETAAGVGGFGRRRGRQLQIFGNRQLAYAITIGDMYDAIFGPDRTPGSGNPPQ